MVMKKKIKIGLICFLVLSLLLVSGCIGPSDDEIILKAQQTKDISLCEKISDVAKREECICGVAMVTYNSGLCEELKTERSETVLGVTSNMKLRDLCFNSIAEEKLDHTLCEKMDEGWMKDDCFAYIAGMTKDKGLCNKISDKTSKEECIETLSSLELGYCENLAADYERDLCIWRRAVLSNNPSECENTSLKDSCYQDIAERTNNPEVCKRITDEITREHCLRKSLS